MQSQLHLVGENELRSLRPGYDKRDEVAAFPEYVSRRGLALRMLKRATLPYSDNARKLEIQDEPIILAEVSIFGCNEGEGK